MVTTAVRGITEVKAERMTQTITTGVHIDDSRVPMTGGMLTRVNMTKQMLQM